MIPAQRLFNLDLVFVDMHIDSTDDLFSQLKDVLDQKGYITQGWLEGVTARERAYPTGLKTPAYDIAIPHTDPEFIARPYIAVIKPSSPVVFSCMGGIEGTAEAKLIINLGVTGDGSQVDVLQRLMNIFLNEQLAKRILSSSTSEELYSNIVEVF